VRLIIDMERTLRQVKMKQFVFRDVIGGNLIRFSAEKLRNSSTEILSQYCDVILNDFIKMLIFLRENF
jgi:hypothetical protein